jgi:hypothetical protein
MEWRPTTRSLATNEVETVMRTLFLQAPSFDGFDGGAGSRYQARREVRSFWYPTWLAQPAALVEDSKLIDAPSHRIKFQQVADVVRDFDLVVLHTSAPSFSSDIGTVKALKEVKPSLKIGMVGAKVAVDPEGSLRASPLIDFVGRNEFDFTIKDVADGKPLSDIVGLSYRNASGVIVHNDERPILENMDLLPFVSPVYKRDLDIRNYFNGYLKHPYLSLYTGRGCKSRCTFCLWPQTIGGHRYRKRSVGHVIEEIAWAKKAFPEVKEFFSTTTPSRTICRVWRRSPRSSASSALPGLAMPSRMCRERHSRYCAIMACTCCWSAMSPAIRRYCTTSRKESWSTSPADSPRIVTTSAS